MTIVVPQQSHHTYALLDSGNGQRLEQFDSQTIIRPDVTCIWQPQHKNLWQNADLICSKNQQGSRYVWKKQKTGATDQWNYSYHHPALQPLTFLLRTSEQSKNVGIFPEQAAHWDWLVERAARNNILNLFAYTGGATLAIATAGAKVCHVDASKTTVAWARQNAERNGLENAPIRWIIEDCLTFMQREIKRGKQYGGIIMDPPAFGRDPNGNVFNFESSIHQLLAAAKQLLMPDGFLLLNVYSVSLYATHVANVVRDYFPERNIEYGELHVQGGGNNVPCNVFVRVS
ncbi:methyltransferase [Candidatus Dependentiae bacterium]|nr:methyltransferase [Candidatus Dependentiae bacterium]